MEVRSDHVPNNWWQRIRWKNKKKKKDYTRIVPNKKEWNKLISKNLLNDSNPPSNDNNKTEDDTNPNPSSGNTGTEEEDYYSQLQEVIETSTDKSLEKIEEVNRKRPTWFVLSENKLNKRIEERNKTLQKYMKERTEDNKEKQEPNAK